MLRVIRFFNRTYDQLTQALFKLNRRYRTVRLHRQQIKGLFSGWFEVGNYIKTPKWM